MPAKVVAVLPSTSGCRCTVTPNFLTVGCPPVQHAVQGHYVGITVPDDLVGRENFTRFAATTPRVAGGNHLFIVHFAP